MLTKKFSVELDRIRWIAAALVVIEHAKNLIFVDYRNVTDKNVLLKMFYFITGMGHHAVIVFFVLSGLLVGGISIRKFLNGRFDFGDYAAHRFSRIYIVLVPAIMVGWLLDKTGLMYFNASQLYTHGSLYGFVRVFADQMEWTAVLGNLLMLQWIAVPSLGSNGPLWSLANEWWYYCVFALILGAVASSDNRLLRYCLAAMAIAILAVLPVRISVWFLIWLVGAGIGFLPLRGCKISRWLAYAIFLGILLWARFDVVLSPSSDIYDNFVRDFAVAAGCFILFTALSQRNEAKRKESRADAVLAGFSYTLYLVHVPFLVFTVAMLHDVFGIAFHRQPSAASFGYFFLLIALAYAYGYLFSRLTEAHTEKLRHWLRRPQAMNVPAR